MGKVGKARKRARREQGAGGGGKDHPHQTTIANNNSPEGLDADDVAVAETTLRLLLDDPELLRSSQARTLRRQAYAIVEVLDGGGGAKSLTGKIGDALHDGQWAYAIELLLQQQLLLLQQQQQDKELPRQKTDEKTSAPTSLQSSLPLGSLQRWIRDLFESTSGNNAAGIDTKYEILNLILQCTGQVPMGDPSEEADLPGPLKILPLWFSVPRTENHSKENDFKEEPSWKIPEIQTLAVEKSWKDGMVLWTCAESIFLEDAARRNLITRQNVPFVRGSFVMNNVLSPLECRRLVKVAHQMGFTPEASYSTTGKTTSPAADGVVWVVNNEMLSEIVARVVPHLPPNLCGGKLVGLNARWRIYHYKAGAVYRPHIDGAWTGSGIVDGVYVNDMYKAGTVTSRLTFLIYLNDDFSGGGTTFYAPSFESNCVVARSIAPIQGSILCFPHGHGVENVGLVHEGSAVTNGSKYVMRSDVLYEEPRSGRVET